MVRDAALGIVVCADLGGAVTGGDHGLALGGDAVKVLLVLHVVETGTEFLHGPFGVLDLGTLLLALHHYSGGDVGEADGRIGGVNPLSAGTGCTEEVFTDIGRVQLYVELACLGEHRYGGGRSLDTALGFGLRHPLHAVHAALVLHSAVHSVGTGRKLEHYLLVAARGAEALVGYLQLPALDFGIVLIHAEEVAGKDRRLVAAGTAADFHDGVLAVVGIGRDEQKFDVLLHVGQFAFDFGNLLAGHVLEVGIALVHEHVLRRGQVIHGLLVLKTGLDDRFQLLVVLVKLHVALHVAHYLGAGQLFLQGRELVLQRQHLFQQCVLACHYLISFM